VPDDDPLGGALTVLPPWVVVVTKAAAEDVAERALRQAGYRVYLPRYRRPMWPHGAARSPQAVMRPLFTGFLFAHEWHGWPAIRVAGTVGLMRSAGRIVEITDQDVALMWQREKSGLFDELPPPQALRVGNKVGMRVHGVEVLGVLEDLSENGKAVVRAMIFNRETVWRDIDVTGLRVVIA